MIKLNSKYSIQKEQASNGCIGYMLGMIVFGMLGLGFGTFLWGIVSGIGLGLIFGTLGGLALGTLLYWVTGTEYYDK